MVDLLQYGISVLVAVQIGEVVTAVLTRKGVLDVHVQPNLWGEGFKYLTWEAEGGGERGEEGGGERRRGGERERGRQRVGGKQGVGEKRTEAVGGGEYIRVREGGRETDLLQSGEQVLFIIGGL